jgi:hypothetical protein
MAENSGVHAYTITRLKIKYNALKFVAILINKQIMNQHWPIHDGIH